MRLSFLYGHGWIENDREISGSLLTQEFEMGFRITSTATTSDREPLQIRQESDDAPRM